MAAEPAQGTWLACLTATAERLIMDELRLTSPPVAETGMLIRRNVAEVFEAFIDPEITTRFWFTGSSGPLEAGSTAQWEWEMFGISVPVEVVTIERDRRIVVRFPGEEGPTTVEWKFAPAGREATFVEIRHSGFTGGADEVVKQAIDSTDGFSLVLAGAKALLEHGLELNLVADRFPKGVDPG